MGHLVRAPGPGAVLGAVLCWGLGGVLVLGAQVLCWVPAPVVQVLCWPMVFWVQVLGALLSSSIPRFATRSLRAFAACPGGPRLHGWLLQHSAEACHPLHALRPLAAGCGGPATPAAGAPIHSLGGGGPRPALHAVAVPAGACGGAGAPRAVPSDPRQVQHTGGSQAGCLLIIPACSHPPRHALALTHPGMLPPNPPLGLLRSQAPAAAHPTRRPWEPSGARCC